MLNDYGKSLFKPWCSVQNVVWGCALVFLAGLAIRTYQLGSDEIAAWVQAIGSVAAIVAATLIAGSQARREQERSDRADAVALEALIVLAERSVHAVKRLHEKQRPNHRSGEDVAYVTACYESFVKIDLLTLPSTAALEQVMIIRSNLEVALQQAEMAQQLLHPPAQLEAHGMVQAAYIVLAGAELNLKLLRAHG
ncbi:hypothetical protein [Pseudomonas juntendi]|uniref:Uncharacterized protein n=1 Tax=Pseudomonas juntendi TaxID=2666183 RepID=A0A7W2JFL7_9PSED|nr:hypothetical protein [Pseudomonas juntendi]MBA6058121.1 hypothetical protein [Pseudomonas juntendi]MBA6126617.1 hypothetical protein [Pseudomonas juntendi]